MYGRPGTLGQDAYQATGDLGTKMNKWRMLGIGIVWAFALATVAPAGAAPATATTATLRGPNNSVCAGFALLPPAGTAKVQATEAKPSTDPGERRLKVTVAATVEPRTTYDVRLAATVVETLPGGGTAVGCRHWLVTTAPSLGNGALRASGAVDVPADIPSFQVFVGKTGGPLLGYATEGVPVSNL